VDRAILDGDTDGLVKVHVRAGTDGIVGATVVARHAGEMISELTLAGLLVPHSASRQANVSAEDRRQLGIMSEFPGQN
jgi:pyruvate/2-oxoglutarate dehydrogenase complex dihydrolipoamide dehydrogenase (E3) component